VKVSLFSAIKQCGKETTRIVDSTLLQNTIACQVQNGLNSKRGMVLKEDETMVLKLCEVSDLFQ